MRWFSTVLRRRPYRVSVDATGVTFLYREPGRQMHVSGEAMADGYAVYAASIQEWKAGVAPDESERQRIAANIFSYFADRGKAVYLA